MTAASKIGGDVDILVGGAGCGAVAEQAAKVAGVRKVFCADAPVFGKPVAEDMEKLILQVQAANSYSHILAPASAAAKSALPRVAAKLDVNQMSDVLGVESEDTFVRPIYAGNALATVKSADSVKVLTIRPTAFDKAEASGGSGAVEAVSCDGAGLSTWKSEQLSKSDRPDLASAGTVIAGGRGLKSGDNFKLVYDLAGACARCLPRSQLLPACAAARYAHPCCVCMHVCMYVCTQMRAYVYLYMYMYI